MITYNPKDWFRLIFRFHSSDTFRILLPTMLLLGLITGGLVYFGKQYQYQVQSGVIFHQIIGFVVSMLLVFRINTAYDRWWEGRRHWGSLVNNVRSLIVKLRAILGSQHPVELQHLASLLKEFPAALRDHLRNLPEAGLSRKPFGIFTQIFDRLQALRGNNVLTDDQLLLINPEVFSLIDITGACERIKNSPIPFSYSLFLKKIIFAYVITMPLTFSTEYGYWAIPAVMLIFYAFASLEIISEEVEEPFGTGANDLPTDELAEKIAQDIDATLAFR